VFLDAKQKPSPVDNNQQKRLNSQKLMQPAQDMMISTATATRHDSDITPTQVEPRACCEMQMSRVCGWTPPQANQPVDGRQQLGLSLSYIICCRDPDDLVSSARTRTHTIEAAH
jgi:hypothetical protein